MVLRGRGVRAHGRSGGCFAASGLGAARDGKRIKDSLERALALDPRLQEAYFGIGLYHYYADVAPTAAKDALAPVAARRRQGSGHAGDAAGRESRRTA